MDRKQCIKLLGLVVLLLCASPARAQTDPYFQWMNAITDDTLTPRMAAHLNAAGIHGHEQEQVAAILSKFKAEEFGLEASYNNLPSTLNGHNDGTEEFYARQAALVQRTIDKLRVALSAASFQHIDDRVQHEAKNIRVAKTRMTHPMLQNVAMGGMPQGVMGMNPAYSLYSTMSAGQVGAGVTASMLVDSGAQPFPQWNASNLVDANTSDVGFSTDTAQAWGSSFYVDLGTAQPIVSFNLFMSASNYAGQFILSYSDGGAWTNSPNTFAPSDAGWNYAFCVNCGSHRYWGLTLANTPGAGPTINEIQLIKSGLELFASFSVTGTTHCPSGCGGALHNGYVTNSLGSPVTGPQISATGFVNVVNAASEFLPAGGPPSTVGSSGDEVDCNVVQGPIQKMPIINNDIEIAITYSQDLGINCASPDPHRPFCREIIDYCLPSSVPPDFDPTQVISSHAWIAKIPFWNEMTFCDRPHGSAPGTSWNCLWPTPSDMVVPHFEEFRHPCTNKDKGTSGVWP